MSRVLWALYFGSEHITHKIINGNCNFIEQKHPCLASYSTLTVKKMAKISFNCLGVGLLVIKRLVLWLKQPMQRWSTGRGKSGHDWVTT